MTDSIEDDLDEILAVDLNASSFATEAPSLPPPSNDLAPSFVVPDPDEEEDEEDDEEELDEPSLSKPSIPPPPSFLPPPVPSVTPPPPPNAPPSEQPPALENTVPTQQVPVSNPSSEAPTGAQSPPPPPVAKTPTLPPPPSFIPPPPPSLKVSVPQTPTQASPVPSPTSMKVEGRLLIKSVLGLPWKGWKPCIVSLQGSTINYAREESTVAGTIDLTNLRKVGTKGIKELPPNALGFILTVDEVKYCFCTDDTAQYYIWLGVVKNMLRVKRGATDSVVRRSSSVSRTSSPRRSKTKGKKTTRRIIALVKQRMGELGNEVNDPTYRFLELLYHAKPTFINAIFSITQQADMDKVAGYLARLFYFVDRALYLAHVVIAWEVENTTTANNLFRQNSIASKIIGAVSRLVAVEYLQRLLKPVVEKICQLGRKLEVDPAKLTPDSNLAENIERVKGVVNDLLECILDPKTPLPIECRQICSFIRQEVSKKFPEACDISIAGYLFLRLINPALVVPDGIGIVKSEALTQDIRRSLVIVSKVVLNMATQVEFKKEQYMLEFNPYIKEKFEVMRNFYAEAANVENTKAASKCNFTVEPLQFLEEVARLYKILHSNQDKLIQHLGPDTPLAKELKSCIDAIGPPDQQQVLQGRSASSSNIPRKASFFERLSEIVSHFFRRD